MMAFEEIILYYYTRCISKYCVAFYKGGLNNNAYVQRLIFIQSTVKLVNRLLNEALSSL